MTQTIPPSLAPLRQIGALLVGKVGVLLQAKILTL
jgi:hypothetical protein